MKAMHAVTLENHTEAFIEDLKSKGGTPIYKLTPNEARNVLEGLQSQHVEKPQVHVEEKKIPGPKGQITIRIFRPAQVGEAQFPTLVYFHGGGWILGSVKTHERLCCDIATGAKTVLVFVEYTRSPEAKFPVAIEEAYAATKYVFEHAKELNLDTWHFAIAGDSVGGNMAIAVHTLAKERHGPRIDSMMLFYPVTSAELNTPSYQQFEEGPWLTKAAMEWFWNAYEPNVSNRKNPLLSPLNIPTDQLKSFPPTLVITDENDVLRDEGEAFAHKLMQAGVKVTAARFLGTIHDFMMLNPLAKTPGTRGAIQLANQFLMSSFKT